MHLDSVSRRWRVSLAVPVGGRAALLNQQAAGRVRVTSADSEPASELNPAVVQAMAEIGIDISAEFPRPLTAGKVPPIS